MDQRSESNLETFKALVANAPTNPAAEKLVREITGGVMETCPMELLIEVGHCIIRQRESEIRNILEN